MRKVAPVMLVLLILATACGGPRTVDVNYTAGSAQVAVGDRLRVDFGTVNTSIGDAWFLIGPPNASVLTDDGGDYASTCLPGMVGCDSQLRWQFTAKGAGSTELIFRYCYRSNAATCDPGPGRGPTEPVHLAVTVTG
jgi:hypothetical protein